MGGNEYSITRQATNVPLLQATVGSMAVSLHRHTAKLERRRQWGKTLLRYATRFRLERTKSLQHWAHTQALTKAG